MSSYYHGASRSTELTRTLGHTYIRRCCVDISGSGSVSDLDLGSPPDRLT